MAKPQYRKDNYEKDNNKTKTITKIRNAALAAIIGSLAFAEEAVATRSTEKFSTDKDKQIKNNHTTNSRYVAYESARGKGKIDNFEPQIKKYIKSSDGDRKETDNNNHNSQNTQNQANSLSTLPGTLFPYPNSVIVSFLKNKDLAILSIVSKGFKEMINETLKFRKTIATLGEGKIAYADPNNKNQLLVVSIEEYKDIDLSQVVAINYSSSNIANIRLLNKFVKLKKLAVSWLNSKADTVPLLVDAVASNPLETITILEDFSKSTVNTVLQEMLNRKNLMRIVIISEIWTWLLAMQ